MKLISMTDFCLQLLNENAPYNEVKMLTQISNYANFLKQPLKLEMFVSDDKEKVLFENIKHLSYNPVDKSNELYDYKNNHLFFIEENETIEYLVEYNLQLTTNAIKQFM